MTNLESYLAKFDESDWLAAVETLLPEIHAVDRNAVQVWFRFYPLSLTRAIEVAENREEAIQGFAMQGDFGPGTRSTRRINFSTAIGTGKPSRRLNKVTFARTRHLGHK